MNRRAENEALGLIDGKIQENRSSEVQKHQEGAEEVAESKNVASDQIHENISRL